MKIGILTYHRVLNYGAYMQAYALSTKIMHMVNEDVSVEIIDYISMQKIQLYKEILIKSIQKKDWKKVKQYYLFFSAQKKMPLSCKTIVGRNACSIINSLEYDVIIVGSDEVWKVDEKPDYVYWLEGINVKYKMSYAASSRIKLEKINDIHRSRVISSWKKFSYLGVRDDITKTEIENELGNMVELNCDPAFLLDLKYDEDAFKKKLYKKYGIPTECKLIGIMLDEHEEICKKLKNIYGDNYKLVSLYTQHNVADYNIIDISPFEWTKVIKSLECLVTCYFHGVVYSIKSNTNFMAIDYSMPEYSKIYDLLLREKLLDKYINGVGISEHVQAKLLEKKLKKDEKCNFIQVVKNERKYFTSFEKKLKNVLDKI